MQKDDFQKNIRDDTKRRPKASLIQDLGIYAKNHKLYKTYLY